MNYVCTDCIQKKESQVNVQALVLAAKSVIGKAKRSESVEAVKLVD